MLKKIKDFLIFSRKERIGLVVLLTIIAIVFAMPLFKSTKAQQSEIVKSESDSVVVYKEKEKRDYSASHYSYDDKVTHTSSLFYFDPNTISFEEWKKLGLRDKTIHTIQNYLSKGGHFYKREDLKKIYGLHPDEFERLLPYISINHKEKEYEDHKVEDTKSDSLQQRKYQEYKTTTAPVYEKKAITVNINTADTTAWIELPGIGSKRAWSIINFRNKLGGFYSIDQVAETYNLPDSVFQQIKPMLQLGTMQVRKININTATKDELKGHPYIRWNIANAIVEYRNQHGNFSKLEDLQKITIMTTELYNKISPYLSL